MTTAVGELPDLLDALDAAVPDGERAAVRRLRARLDDQRFRVLVVGEAKRGKSTLVNALLGTPLLPVGVTPVTALPTQIRHGAATRLLVTHRDGREVTLPVTALADLVTEAGNPGNRRQVEAVTVYVDAPLLADHVEIVDTPGIGSVYGHDVTANATLETMDAALLVLTADPPVSASERDLLRAVRARSVAVFVALNKIDYLEPTGRGEAERFTADVVADALGERVPVHSISSRQALSARQADRPADLAVSGVPALESALIDYLTRSRRTDLYRSIAGHAHRITTRSLDQTVLTLRAAEMTAGQTAGRVDEFRGRLDGLDQRRRDAVDVIRATAARLLSDLNDAARWDRPAVTAEVRRQLHAHLDTALAGATAGRMDHDGRAFCIARIREAVDGWRRERRRVLDDGLAALDARLATGIGHELDAVRAAAQELLGVELALPAPAGSLLPETPADYAFEEEIGQTELIAGTVRRHLPGRLGRRNARRHLDDELDRLVDKQFGRSRAGFQQALDTAGRALTRAMEARYTEAAAGLMRALEAAHDIAMAATADADTRRRELDGRAGVLGALTVELARWHSSIDIGERHEAQGASASKT